MATEEHKIYANIIKEVHDDLRKQTKIIGSEKAWEEHLKNTNRLANYSKAMFALAEIWEENSNKTTTNKIIAHSRIKWIIEFCNFYFFTERFYLIKRQREERILDTWIDYKRENCKYMNDQLPISIRILDVGSCFNPFGHVPHFDVIALDLCPANNDVLRGDFLKIPIEDQKEFIEKRKTYKTDLKTLPREYFECVIFSLLLEYIPSSQQRIKCCQKAYELLVPEGILIIITPDSQNVGKNAALMKTWRYTLATLGFMRIKFEKLSHITCMVFRKTIDPELAYRWAKLHHEEYMSVSIEIPQDTKW